VKRQSAMQTSEHAHPNTTNATCEQLRRENQRLRKIVRIEFIARGMTTEQADAALAEALVIEGCGTKRQERHAHGGNDGD
jgi:hypothetical protein